MVFCIPLSRILDATDKDKAYVLLGEFICSRNKDEELFLHEKAIPMEKRHMCRTYLFTDEKAIIGFITLGLKCTKIDNNAIISRKMRSRLSINPDTQIAQCFLLAQSCRSDDSPKGFGTVLMSTAKKMFQKGDVMFGCRTVRLDCKDELIDYYKGYGFVSIRKNLDNDLTQMICTI